jgi:hypothetical protein
MLTLFTVPQPFRGEFSVIQRNAIRSWAKLDPACEIILLGNEEGTREMAAEVGATHVAELERNEFGTPLLSSVFGRAEQQTCSQLLCYINADIILLDDFLPAIHEAMIWNPRSLVVGRRWDMELSESLSFDADWEDRLRERAQRFGMLHPATAVDFFVFEKGLWSGIPPFAIGRGLYDQWLLYKARSMRLPVIDATRRVLSVHQNHSRPHLLEGSGPTEYAGNFALADGYKHAYTTLDATHQLTKSGVRRRWLPLDVRRAFIWPITTSAWGKPLVRALRVYAPGAPPSPSGEAL